MAKTARFLLLFCALNSSCIAATLAADATNGDLSWALAYETPGHSCVRPKQRKSNEVAGQYDKMKRKTAQFNRCVKEFHGQLIEDHQKIVQAARTAPTGFTEQQGQSLLAKVRDIEKTLEELGENLSIPHDQYEIERFFHIGNRPSI
jgi:hypothetical protein